MGNQVEGSEGTYTFVWKVVTEGTDSVDVQFQLTPDGGIDFTLFMIDQGDAPAVEEAKQVAYLHASGINMEEYMDMDYVMLDGNEKFDLTTIAATEDVTLESLADFDAVLISPSITKVKEANVVKPLIGFIPVINLNAGIYESLGLGKAVNTNLKDLTIVDPTNAIFEGIDAIEFEEGITAVELDDYFKAEGTTAYFNFNKAKTTALSQPYTEPIELTEPVIITVLTEGEGLLPSNLVSQYVGINGIDNTTIRLDTLAHFNANETDWFINDTESGAEGKASAYYFWGKAAWNYYTDEVEDTKTVKASDGVTDSIINIYKVNPEALKVINPLNENGWVLKSEGQVLTGELQLAPGEGVGNGATGRFAEEAIDFIGTPSKGVITFGAKTSGDPYTARIESTKKLAGPFDVIVYCGNGNNAGAGILEIQTSADGETWATLDTLKMAATQRYIKRTRASFNETAEVFLRVAQVSGGTKAQVYDILVMNNGELSKAYSEADMAEKTGIQTVQPQGTVVSTEVFTLGGSRIANAGRGMQIVRKTYANGAVVTKKVLR